MADYWINIVKIYSTVKGQNWFTVGWRICWNNFIDIDTIFIRFLAPPYKRVHKVSQKGCNFRSCATTERPCWYFRYPGRVNLHKFSVKVPA